MVFRASCCRSDTSAVELAAFIDQSLGHKGGSIVIATVEASAVDHGRTLGLVLGRKSSNDCPAIVLERILPGSPFEKTSLQPGMVLFRINDIDLDEHHPNVSQVETYLFNARRQTVRVWARLPCSSKNHTPAPPEQHTTVAAHAPPRVATLETGSCIVVVAEKKDGQDSSLGLSLTRDEITGKFFVERIDSSSPLYRRASSLLREGMIITSVNGLMITGMDLEVVLSTIGDSPRHVVLTAEIPVWMEEPPIFRRRVIATINKTDTDQSLGLSFIRIPLVSGCYHHHHHSPKKKFATVVGRIASQSPFQDTELQVGMMLVSINGVEVAGSDTRSILHYLQQCPGKVTVLAELDVPAEEITLEGPERSSSTNKHSKLNTPKDHREDHQDGQRTECYCADPTMPWTRDGCSQRLLQPHVLSKNPESPRISTVTSTEASSRSSMVFQGTANISSTSSTTSWSNYNGRAFTVEAMKASHNHRAGLALNEDSGSFFVSDVTVDSIFRDTELKVGCEILNINGIQLFGTDKNFVATILDSVVGRVQLEVLSMAD